MERFVLTDVQWARVEPHWLWCMDPPVAATQSSIGRYFVVCPGISPCRSGPSFTVRVIGAKVRADFAPAHNVPQSDAQKWRNSVAVVPFATACCTCVPGLLPRLQFA